MGYVPFEGNLNTNGFPIGNFGKKYKVHLPKKYQTNLLMRQLCQYHLLSLTIRILEKQTS